MLKDASSGKKTPIPSKTTKSPKVSNGKGLTNGSSGPINGTLTATANASEQGRTTLGRSKTHGAGEGRSVAGQRRPRVAYMHSDDEEEEDPGQPAGESPRKKRKVDPEPDANPVAMDATRRKEREEMKRLREELPIFALKERLVREVRERDTIVLRGETGSGKTTQMPQYLHEAGFTKDGMIAITQPRRVAATSIAQRVAYEQGTPLGQLVGYSVRFEECTSAGTRIKFVTDGMLVRELLLDPMLEKYSVVIVDEAHERTLRTDMILGSLKRIQRIRNAKGQAPKTGKQLKPLKVIIMSATLDADRFAAFFDNAPVVYVEGRKHKITVRSSKVHIEDFVWGCMQCLTQIHLHEPPGDVLIFMPGQDDIEALMKQAQDWAAKLKDGQQVLILPIYSALPPAQQKKVFSPAPEGYRKVVIATNIAETSITIPNMRYVIDTGLCKERSYHTRHGGSGLDELLVKPISKSNAVQRMGRAGRDGVGVCYRLYTEETFNALAAAPTPEIQRCDLNSAVLDLKVLGEDPLTFDYIDRPLDDAIRASLMTLYALQALDARGQLTPLGRKMSSFPLEPALALVVLSSKARACTSEVLDIVSLLTSTAKLYIDNADTRDQAAEARKKFQHRDGDHLTLLNIFRSYEDVVKGVSGRSELKHWCKQHFLSDKALTEAVTIREQLRGNCERANIDWRVSCGDDPDPILKCLLDGLFRKVAIRAPDGTYRQIGMQQVVKIHPSSSLVGRKPATIIFDELIVTTAVYARGVSAIHSSWLVDTPLLNNEAKKDDLTP